MPTWMLIFVYTILCFLPSLHRAVSGEEFEPLPVPEKIVGVRGNVDFAIPYMVGIEISSRNGEIWNLTCGGSIISNHWILTAAHCFVDYDNCDETRMDTVQYARVVPKRRFRIFYSTLNKLQVNMIENNIKKIHMYTNKMNCFDPQDDIALIQLGNSIPLGPITSKNSDKAQAIQLNRHFGLNPGDALRLYGFGFGSNDTLKEANLAVVNQRFCETTWKHHYKMRVHSTEFCSTANQSDAGRGDSGGPLIIVRDKRFYLAGIVSRGSSQTNEEKVDERHIPGVNTDVRSYIEWIEKTILDYTVSEDYLAYKIRRRYQGEELTEQPEVTIVHSPEMTTIAPLVSDNNFSGIFIIESTEIPEVWQNFSTLKPEVFQEELDKELYGKEIEWIRKTIVEQIGKVKFDDIWPTALFYLGILAATLLLFWCASKILFRD